MRHFTAVVLALLAALTLTAAFAHLMPGAITARFSWAGMIFPLLWPSLVFWSYWPKRTTGPILTLGLITVACSAALAAAWV